MLTVTSTSPEAWGLCPKDQACGSLPYSLPLQDFWKSLQGFWNLLGFIWGNPGGGSQDCSCPLPSLSYLKHHQVLRKET